MIGVRNASFQVLDRSGVCTWRSWGLRLLLLGIMALMGWRPAGANPSGAKASRPKDQIAIKVLDWVPKSNGQLLRLEIEYRLASRPDRLGSFAWHNPDPREQSEHVASTYLHHAFVPARFEIQGAWWKQKSIELRRVDQVYVAYPKIAKAEPGTLRVRGELFVPRAKWPLGCVRGQCAAVGAAALLPMQWDAKSGQGWPIPAQYSVQWLAKRRPAGLLMHASTAQDHPILAPALFWGISTQARRPITSFTHRGVKVKIAGALAPLHRSVNNHALWPWPRHQLGHLQRLAQEAIDTATGLGLSIPAEQGLKIVVGPLRAQMAQSYAGLVLVSDRFLDTLPRPRFAKFHDAAVVRSMLDSLVLASMISELSPRELAWLPGALGASMMGDWRERRRLRDEDMAQILSPLGFLPGVDDVLYSGQAAQAGSFFRSADESMPLRRHPVYFANHSPTGFRLYNKLMSRLGPKGFLRWREALLRDPSQDPIAVAQAIAKAPLGDFFAQWLSHYPEVDYAVGHTSSEPIPTGYRHRIELIRVSKPEIHESVQVRIRDRSGKVVNRVWAPKGQGRVRETMIVDTPGKLRRVEIDPEMRLQESPMFPTRSFERQAQGDPRFNNTKPGRVRFVYTGVFFNLAFAELLRAKTRKAKLRTFSGYLSWEAGLKRDLRRMFYFSLSKGRASWVSGDAGLKLSFGRKMTGNRRLYALTMGGGVDWLTDAGLDGLGGVGTQLRVSLTRDTRRFARTPEQGHRIRLSLGRSDDWLGASASSLRHRSDWSLGLSVAKYLRLAHNHVLALQGRLYGSFGLSAAMFRGLVRAGGIGGLAGFGADELLGRGVAMLKAEYRHVFLDSLRWNMLGLVWIRDLGGVAFTGGAFVSDCDRIGGFDRRQNYVGQVGYGLTLRYDILGIAPQLMRLGVSLPLGRARRQCLGQEFPGILAKRQGIDPARAPELLAPFALNLSFAHDF